MTVPTDQTVQPQLDESQLALQYGWAMAVLNSDESLKNLFHEAVRIGYTPAQFAAKVRETDWYKTHSESARQASILKTTDPATYESRYQASRSTFLATAAQMGATITGTAVDDLSRQAYELGWSDQQVRNVLGQYINFSDPNYGGLAGAAEDEIREYARNMGVKLDENSIANWAKAESVSGGSGAGINVAKQVIQNTAISAFPSMADRIKAGESVQQIASPYIQSMANTLELNSESLDVFDPTIRTALLSTSKDGKPATLSLWDFEKQLKDDPRWMRTKNAQDSVMSTTRKILSDFGLGGN